MGALCKGPLITNHFTYKLPLKTWGQWRSASTIQKNNLLEPTMLHSFGSFVHSSVLWGLVADLCLQCFLFPMCLRLNYTLSVTVTLLFLVLSGGSFPSFPMSIRVFLSFLVQPSHHLLFWSTSFSPQGTSSVVSERQVGLLEWAPYNSASDLPEEFRQLLSFDT